MHKVDFTAAPEQQEAFTDVSVGQKLQLVPQESGGWACARQDGSVVCAVPPDAAARMRQAQPGGTPAAVIRSVKRSQQDANAAVSIQVRITFPEPDQAQPLQQAPAPVDDPAGFSLTTRELEQLAYDTDIRATLQDKRLQSVLLKVDGAPNREEALKQALDNPDFREFADKMLAVMKPEQYPPVP